MPVGPSTLDKAVQTTDNMFPLLENPCTSIHDLGQPADVLVQAATGEDVSAEDLGGAELHCTTSGLAVSYMYNTTLPIKCSNPFV